MADIFSGKAGLDPRATIAMAVAGGVSLVVIVWYTTHISRWGGGAWRGEVGALRGRAQEQVEVVGGSLPC